MIKELNIMRKQQNKNGFTLIELIMVMIILGILSAVAIPRYLETIQKSEVASEDAVIDKICLLYTSPSPRDKRQSRMPSSA